MVCRIPGRIGRALATDRPPPIEFLWLACGNVWVRPGRVSVRAHACARAGFASAARVCVVMIVVFACAFLCAHAPVCLCACARLCGLGRIYCAARARALRYGVRWQLMRAITVTYKQSYEVFFNTIGDAIRSQLTRAATCTQTATGLYVFCKYYIALVDVLLVRP